MLSKNNSSNKLFKDSENKINFILLLIFLKYKYVHSNEINNALPNSICFELLRVVKNLLNQKFLKITIAMWSNESPSKSVPFKVNKTKRPTPEEKDAQCV